MVYREMLDKEYKGKLNADSSQTKWFKKMGYTAHPGTGKLLSRSASDLQHSAPRQLSELSGLPPPRERSTVSTNLPSVLSVLAGVDDEDDGVASRSCANPPPQPIAPNGLILPPVSPPRRIASAPQLEAMLTKAGGSLPVPKKKGA